jgi:hypothetical protein
VISVVLARSGWSPARALAIGVLLYLVYNYAIYTTSIAMNRLALIYIAVLGLTIGWAPHSPDEVRRSCLASGLPRHLRAGEIDNQEQSGEGLGRRVGVPES